MLELELIYAASVAICAAAILAVRAYIKEHHNRFLGLFEFGAPILAGAVAAAIGGLSSSDGRGAILGLFFLFTPLTKLLRLGPISLVLSPKWERAGVIVMWTLFFASALAISVDVAIAEYGDIHLPLIWT